MIQNLKIIIIGSDNLYSMQMWYNKNHI